MADYISQWTGPLIDTGIDLALNGIGCKKYPDCSLDRPLDLNKLHDTIRLSTGETINANGSWLVDFYINGPVIDLSSINTTNYTPVQIDVYVANNYTYQSLIADGVFYYRYAPIGEDVTMDWLMIAYPRLENDVSSSGEYIQINDLQQGDTQSFELLFKIEDVASYNVSIVDEKQEGEEIDLLPNDLTTSQIVVATVLTVLIFW